MAPMRRRAALVVVCVLALTAAGCSDSKFRYVVNSTENISFRVPRSWTVYSLPTGAQDRISPDSPDDVELLWSSGFDADPNPAREHLDAMTDYGRVTVEHPVGVASVYQIQGTYNQRVSLTAARTVPLGVDPLFVSDDVRSLVEIIDYQPVTNFRGLQGTRVVFNLRSTSDSPWSTYDMLTLVDQGRFRMYTFTVGCLGPCFESSRRQLTEIATSWRFEQ